MSNIVTRPTVSAVTAANLRAEVYRTAEAYDMHGAQPVELAGGEIGVKMPAKRHSILCWLYWANGSGRYWRIEDEARVEPFRISARRPGRDAFPPALLLVRDAPAMA